VEGEGGFFRRNHLVPVPVVRDYAHLNELLLEASQRDEHRMVGDRALCVSAAMAVERKHLLPLAKEGFRFPNGRRYSRMLGCARRCWIG
jgi:hypothetical protein